MGLLGNSMPIAYTPVKAKTTVQKSSNLAIQLHDLDVQFTY
jgi:hypothetical protein